ncbi:hypothetical protein [Pseudomonas shirazica]|uniref:hypothetical protein n=1 Tax=Pseudomonas shirazica TaxID=1940636 RepID=UPI001EE153DE|nr:hypothetical protein [Pseudomonas shirazica]
MHSLTDEQVLAIIHENSINRALLAALPALDIPHCMLTAGALMPAMGRKAAPNWLTDRHYPHCLTIGTSTERRLV